MPIPTPASLPKAAWAVLLYGPPPEIQLLAGELDDSGLEIVRIGDHFFLQVPEVFAPLSLVCQPETGTRGCCVSQRERRSFVSPTREPIRSLRQTLEPDSLLVSSPLNVPLWYSVAEPISGEEWTPQREVGGPTFSGWAWCPFWCPFFDQTG